jgi:GGDEF domain-containing protein
MRGGIANCQRVTGPLPLVDYLADMTPPDRPAGPASRQALTRVFPRSANVHWLEIAALLADVAFETDHLGAFTAFAQAEVLGMPMHRLIGKNIADFCKLPPNTPSPPSGFGAIFGALSRENRIWRSVVTLTRGDGSEGAYRIALAPKPLQALSAKARQVEAAAPGAYGLLVDLQAPELQMLSSAANRADGMLDAQTGLWSASAFAEEAGRRFDRLDVEGVPGTLLLLGFSRTPKLGQHAVATRLAQELRDVSRPTDLIGRINVTTFALWCDGMDDLTGAERAARFCQRLPAALPGNPNISVGFVARWPGNMEDTAGLIRQAETALRHAEGVAKAAADAGSTEPVAKGTWRVWNPPL